MKTKNGLTVLIEPTLLGHNNCLCSLLKSVLSLGVFQNVPRIPKCSETYCCIVCYVNINSWVTSDIYKQRSKDLVSIFSKKSFKLLLIVDNCAARTEVSELQAIRVKYLVLNSASFLQQMNQVTVNSYN